MAWMTPLEVAEEAWIKARGDEAIARYEYETHRIIAGLPVCRSWMHRGGYDDTCPSCEKPRSEVS